MSIVLGPKDATCRWYTKIRRNDHQNSPPESIECWDELRYDCEIINLFGEVIVPKFDFPYNNHGIDFLKKKVGIAKKQTEAKKVFFAMESTGHYHENLASALMSRGYDVVITNPSDTKSERDNLHAKTDAIDLVAIAKVIMTNKGKRSYIPDCIYSYVKRFTRK